MQQRSEDTRARIQAAAVDLFARHGYDATGVAEICSAAGVSKGAFYHHFPSKLVLFLALLEDWLAGVEEGLQIAHPSQGSRSIPRMLVDMAGRSGGLFQSAEGQLRLILEFWTQASRKPEVWKAAIAPYRRYEALFSGMLAEGQKEGSLAPEIDPAVAARVVVGLAMGLLLQALFDPDGAAWPEVTRKGVEMLVEGIQRREG